MQKKGQAGLEYMLIFAFSLLIVGLLWIYSGTNVQDTRWDLQLAYARSSVNKITEVSDVAFVQGPPSQFFIYPTFPDNIRNIYISENTITLELLWKDDILRNVSSTTFANITGNVSTAAGQHRILVKAYQNYVDVTEP